MTSYASTRRRRRAGLAAMGTALALTLVGCVTIPTSGPVITGREVSEQELQVGVEVIVEGPVAGSDQETLLSGFIAAYSGSGNYDVARQFLSHSFAEEWDPRESVLVRTGSTHFDRVNDASIDYSILNSAILDRDGVYTSFQPTSQTLNYQFTKEDGEWRISGAPGGIVLTAGTFSRLFAGHAIYFLDPTRQSLVPDLRWFPTGTAATRIVSALLNGPPAWLQGAVGTAFPEGTQLASPRRVTVDARVATIDLTSEALAAGENQRQLMRAQLEASLGKVLSLTSIQLSVEGTPLSIPPLGADAPQLRPQIDSRMLVLRDGEFGYLSNNKITPIDDLSAKVVATQPRDATMGGSGTAAVTLGDGGVYLVRSSVQEPTLIDSRPGLIGPDLDGYGYLWSAQRSDPSSIRAFDTGGNEFPVATALPADAEIISLAVSRDGARIALLLRTDAGPRLMVAAIIRDQNRDQVPLSIGEARMDVIVASGVGIDLSWMDELSVATLTSAGDEYSVTAYQVGGKSRMLGDPGESTAIIGGTNENGLRVLRADGVIAIKRPSGWQSGPTVTLIAAQR